VGPTDEDEGSAISWTSEPDKGLGGLSVSAIVASNPSVVVELDEREGTGLRLQG
jgi:hypothetical protein